MDQRFSGPGGTWAGGPSSAQKSYASSLNEADALIKAYEHLTGLPDPPEALHRLRKIASLVKPIMRKRGWHVGTLTEFLPEEPRLLGLNINHGHKICIRLRFSHNPSSFLPIEQCVDTMLHELSHIIFGPHDAKFHALWDELRSEHETLLMKGYTGEGFLTKGRKLGGGRMPPNSELRRLAKQNAEEQKRSRKDKEKKSGFKLGGKSILPGQDPRRTIADAVERRNTINRGCASGDPNAASLARQSTQQTIRTQSDENDANDRAIAEALLELMEDEEMAKLDQNWDNSASSSAGLAWDPKTGLSSIPATSRGGTPPTAMSEHEQLKWALRESMKTLPLHDSDKQRSVSPLPRAPTGLSIHRPGSAPLPPHMQGEVNKAQKRPRSFTPENDGDIIMSGALDPPSSVHLPVTNQSVNKRPSASRSSSASSVLSDLAGALSAADGPTWKKGIDDIKPSHSPVPHPQLRSPLSPLPPDRSTVAEQPPPKPPRPLNNNSTWTCDICTCINPSRYLVCDACGLERSSAAASTLNRSHPDGNNGPPAVRSSALNDRSAARNLERIQRQSAVLTEPASLGWTCRRCSTFMEHQYWTCSVCGLMKGDSRANEHVVR